MNSKLKYNEIQDFQVRLIFAKIFEMMNIVEVDLIQLEVEIIELRSIGWPRRADIHRRQAAGEMPQSMAELNEIRRSLIIHADFY